MDKNPRRNDLVRLGFFLYLTAMKTKILPFILLLLTACGMPKNKARIEGTFGGIRQSDILVYEEDDAFAGIDTIKVRDGKFSYERSLDKKVVLTLLFPNFSEMYLVAEPGKAIEIKGNAGKLLETVIEGTEDNELLTEFRRTNLQTSDAALPMAAADFIHSHPNTLAAVVLFRQYFVKTESPDAKTTLTLLDALRKAQPDNATLGRIDERLRPLLDTNVGSILPDFTVTLLDGDSISRSDLLGKPLLVCFTAAWHPDFHRAVGQLRRLRNDYGDRLNILNVSLDENKKSLLRKIEDDSIESITVCDEKGFHTLLAQRCGVRYVPGNILTDEKGEILRRDIPVRVLSDEVAKLLKK